MDPVRPHATWILLRGETILTLGDGRGPDAPKRIDAGGRLVLPGFQDAHIHLLNGGVDLVETAQLYDCTTTDDIVLALRCHARNWSGPMVWGAAWQVRKRLVMHSKRWPSTSRTARIVITPPR